MTVNLSASAKRASETASENPSWEKAHYLYGRLPRAEKKRINDIYEPRRIALSKRLNNRWSYDTAGMFGELLLDSINEVLLLDSINEVLRGPETLMSDADNESEYEEVMLAQEIMDKIDRNNNRDNDPRSPHGEHDDNDVSAPSGG